MKKCSILVASVLAISTLFSSCYVGSFSALNWCFELNQSLTGNKYLNAVIAFILGPFEFMIGGFIDVVILNTVEFWTGSNPMAEATTVKGSDGNLYTIAPTQNGGYTITNDNNGKVVDLLFEASTHTWSIQADGLCKKFITLTDQDNAIIYLSDGTARNITLDEAGLTACRNMSIDYNMALK